MEFEGRWPREGEEVGEVLDSEVETLPTPPEGGFFWVVDILVSLKRMCV